MSIQNKLIYLNDTKDAIKNAIIEKGISVSDSDTFRSYADKIKQIQENSGSTKPQYTGHADAEGLKAIGWTDDDIQYYQENGVNWNEEDDDKHKVPQENIDLYGVLNDSNISQYKDYIVYLPKIEITKTSCYNIFKGCSALIAIPYLDTSNVTNMSSMFYTCYSLVSVPQLDTSNVTKMDYMFYYCKTLTTIPQLDTSNVTNMDHMFYYCFTLTTLPQLDTSNVTNMDSIVSYCYSLTTIPQLNTSNVTNMSGMFSNCYSLTTIPQLDTSNVTNMNAMFSDCHSLTTIPQLNTSNVTIMSGMFSNCYSLITLPQLDCSKVTSDLLTTFSNCNSLTSIKVLNLKPTDSMQQMFYGNYSLISISKINISEATNFGLTFTSLYNLRNIELEGMKNNLEIATSPLLSKESLLYIIKNAVPTSRITLKVHSKVYDKYIEDPEIVSALEAQPNITLSK